MPKIVRSISLDHKTDLLAQEKSNFSRWVREQLLSETIYAMKCIFPNDDQGESLEICNGMKKPRCTICYPVAPPDRNEWKLFRGSKMTPDELRSIIAEKYEKVPLELELLAESSVNEAFTPPLRHRKYVRRSLKWI